MSISKRMKLLIISAACLFIAGLSLFLLPKPPLLEGLSFSQAVYTDKGQLLRMTLSSDQKYRLFTPLPAIANTLLEATLLQEDRYFRQHYGVNPVSLAKAVWKSYVVHARRMGASTITMQVARLRYGMHSKTVWGKWLQIIKALQLEMHYSKDEILEAYVNLVPYGSNIEGIGAASLIYFNTHAAQLTLPQALTLSVMPQNPNKRTPQNGQLQAIRKHLLTQWLQQHPDDRSKKMLFDLPLVMQGRQALPFIAPHLVNSILQDPANQQQNLHTALDLRLQRIVQSVTSRYLALKNPYGVTNAAVMLVDTRDMRVKALLGSADFFNQSISGQINGTQTKRSPGSTLKPFIYGLALDQGLIHPNTVLKDVPQSFNGYNPENFDYDFMGPIQAKVALRLSRNVPAIFLANQLKNPTLYQLLETAQVSNLHAQSYYGLSLHLGGVELTMKELVSLYAMLVNQGVWYPVHFLAGKLTHGGKRLLSPEASYLVLDMLTQTHAGKPLAFKTGTSSGYRDAWTVGAFGPYVLGVWVGNFNNKANPAFVGKEVAAPLFLALTASLRQELGPLPAFNANPNHLHLKKIQVCKASGNLPTRYCQDREWTWFIPGKSPITTDTIYKEVAINATTGLRTCHIDANTRFEIFEFWPSDSLAIFQKAGIYRHTPPFFEKGCAFSSTQGVSPLITSPQKGISYVVRLDAKAHNKIPLSAVTDAGIQTLYWFINGSFIAKTKAGTPYFWQATPGRFIIRAVDDHGLSDARDVKVHMDS